MAGFLPLSEDAYLEAKQSGDGIFNLSSGTVYSFQGGEVNADGAPLIAEDSQVDSLANVSDSLISAFGGSGETDAAISGISGGGAPVGGYSFQGSSEAKGESGNVESEVRFGDFGDFNYKSTTDTKTTLYVVAAVAAVAVVFLMKK